MFQSVLRLLVFHTCGFKMNIRAELDNIKLLASEDTINKHDDCGAGA